ncbi:MAG: thioredoxin [Clostridia bacterium]|nr:thioredoxin [Clostridia bacterium]
MSVHHITKENFEQEILNSEKPVVLDFWADWCGPCNRLTPIIEELAASHPELKVAKVHVDQQRELAKQHKVFSIPTLVIYKDGQITARSTGVRPASEILDLI